MQCTRSQVCGELWVVIASVACLKSRYNWLFQVYVGASSTVTGSASTKALHSSSGHVWLAVLLTMRRRSQVDLEGFAS